MDIFSLLGSRASLAIIGVLMVGLTWGGLKLKIWRLEGQLATAQTEIAEYKNRNLACQTDLGTLRLSFFRQNERVDQMKAAADAVSLAADQAALQELTTPEELEQVEQAPPGHGEMNRFMVDLLREGS